METPSLSRRTLLGAMGAALSGAFTQVSAQTEKGGFDMLSQMVSRLTRKADVILLQDRDHWGPSPDIPGASLRGPLSDPAFLNRAKKDGVTDLYMEFPKEFQPYAEQLAAGRIRPEQFTDAVMRDTANILQQNGIKAVDLRNFGRTTKEIADNIVAASAAGIKVHLADPQSTLEAARMVVDGKVSSFAISQRISRHDPQVARDIKDTRQGIALVIYGSLHSLPVRPDNIQDSLRAMGLRTGSIFLTHAGVQNFEQGFNEYSRSPQPLPPDSYGTGVNIPDFLYSPIANMGAELDRPGPVVAPVAPRPQAPGTPLRP